MSCSGLDCDFASDRTHQHLLEHVRLKVPTSIRFEELAELSPRRSDFQDSTQAQDSTINRCDPILFQPISVVDNYSYFYKIYMFGILVDGSKTCVIIKNPPLFVEVRCPDGENPTKTRADLLNLKQLMKVKSPPDAHDRDGELVHLYDLNGFSEDKKPYIRVYFNTLYHSKEYIKFISSVEDNGLHNYITSNDEHVGYLKYFNVLARRYKFNTAGWNTISKYRLDNDKSVIDCKYVLSVYIDNIRKYDGEYSRELQFDKTLLSCWDIETKRNDNNVYQIPKPDDEFTIFTVSSAHYWHYDSKPLVIFCVTNRECEVAAFARSGECEYSNLVVVVCKKDREVLEAHLAIMKSMKCDILTSYNGGCFDWPMLVSAVNRASLGAAMDDAFSTLAFVRDKDGKHNRFKNPFQKRDRFYKNEVKSDAGNWHVLDLIVKYPGMVDIDSMMLMKSVYSKSEVGFGGSLNYYLSLNNLGLKVDMPIMRMFHIYDRATQLVSSPRSCHCSVKCSLCLDHDPIIDRSTPDEQCCFCTKYVRNLYDMAVVGYYCAVDSVKPVELMICKSIIIDKREVANLACISLYDAMYKAGGMKVLNILGGIATDRETAYSGKRIYEDVDIVYNNDSDSDSDDDVKSSPKPAHKRAIYPGGYVFPPVKGLEKQYPYTGLDFSSLYPSEILAYNLSIDMVVNDPIEVARLTEKGYVLREIEPFTYEFGTKRDDPDNEQRVTDRAWVVFHNNLEDDCDDIITGYSREWIFEWTDSDGKKMSSNVRPSCLYRTKFKDTPIYGRKRLPGERFGIFAYTAKKLLRLRSVIKKMIEPLVDLYKKMEKDQIEFEMVDGMRMTALDIRYKVAILSGKQLALKLMINTLYGKCGEFGSPIYNLNVAGGVTLRGRESIQFAANFVQSKGWTIKYGDTDSIYIEAPRAQYKDIDEKYEADLASGVEKDIALVTRGESVVLRTMNLVDNLREEIGYELMMKSNTKFLNMAYEEVTYPTSLNGKKKYFLYAHEKIFNPRPKDIFIRGIEIVKQGTTKLCKELANSYMRTALDLNNNMTPLELAKQTISDIVQKNWSIEMFTITKKYNPSKQSTQTKFVNLMKSLQSSQVDEEMKSFYDPPLPLDKFDYVVIETPYKLKIVKDTVRSGGPDKLFERMMTVALFTKLKNMGASVKIDLTYYIKNFLGILGRFAISDPQFRSGEQLPYKKEDKINITNSVNFLTEFYFKMIGYDKQDIKNQHKLLLHDSRHKANEFKYARRNLLGSSLDSLLVCGDVEALLAPIIENCDVNLEWGRDLLKMILESEADLKLINSTYTGGWDDENGKKIEGLLDKRIRRYESEQEELVRELTQIVDDLRVVNMNCSKMLIDNLASSEVDSMLETWQDKSAVVERYHKTLNEIKVLNRLTIETKSLAAAIKETTGKKD